MTRRVELDEVDVQALWSVAGKLQGRLRGTGLEPKSPADVAQRLLKARRERAELFGPAVGSLLGEAAYDILLDLYVAYAARQTTSVTSACIASGVPPTTALRTIRALVEGGAIVRHADPGDRRRALLALTDETAAKVAGHLNALRASTWSTE